MQVNLGGALLIGALTLGWLVELWLARQWRQAARDWEQLMDGWKEMWQKDARQLRVLRRAHATLLEEQSKRSENG